MNLLFQIARVKIAIALVRMSTLFINRFVHTDRVQTIRQVKVELAKLRMASLLTRMADRVAGKKHLTLWR